MSFIISKQHRGRNFAPHCFLLILSMLLASSLVSQTAPSTTPAAIAAPAIPHLRKQGTATQLIVDDKPFLTLAGELANDSATSLDNMKLVWPKVVQGKLNTVLAGVSWAQLEPEEGKFDFSVVDGIVRGARSHNVHLILLWFASWKNGLSSYPPDWVKKDFERFPRAQIQSGKSLELLTPFSEANRDADAHAFAALMRHVKEIDGRQHTVIMIQVENELGMQGDSRDRSPAANKAFAEPAPRELMDYLQAHKDTLIPEFRQEWEANGSKTSGDWEQVFGQNVATDEIFMAWNFARYIGHVAEAGKSEYPIPMYLNVAVGTAVKKHDVAKTLTQERQEQRGGRFFAVGSALDDLLDVWRAGAPQIDMFSPDSYSDFVEFCEKYDRPGNPLFIPENLGGPVGAARAIYAFGRHDAIGFTSMGAVERSPDPDKDLIGSYELIDQLAPLISAHQGDGTMSAVMLGPNDPPEKIHLGNYTLEVAFLKPRVAPLTQASEIPPNTYASAIFIATGPDEYFVAGNGVTVTFSTNSPGLPLAGLATVEDGAFVHDRWVPGRRLAGDDTEEGEGLRLRWPPGSWVPYVRQRTTAAAIQRVTLYRYR